MLCVLCPWWPLGDQRGDLTWPLAAKSSYLLGSDAAVGMVTCSVCLDELLFPARTDQQSLLCIDGLGGLSKREKPNPK